MRKGRLIVRIVLGVALLLIVALGAAWAMIDPLAKKGIQVGGESALGVPTNVQEVRVSVLGGTLMINGLKFDNPAGFSTPYLMKTGRFDLAVKSGSVLGDTIEIPLISLDGLDVNIQQLLTGSNVSVVLDHVRKLGGPANEAKDDSSPGKKIKVAKFVVKNVTAHVSLPSGAPLTVRVPEIVLNDVGSDGVPLGRLIARLVPAILASIVESGKGVIPADLQNMLQGDIAKTASALGGKASQLVGQVGGETAQRLQDAAGGLLKDTKDVKPPDVDGALKGLLGGQKKTEPK